MNNQTEQEGVIGELVKAAMDVAGIKSEGELSRLSGVPQPTVHRIITGESREPKTPNLRKLAEACGLPGDAFTHVYMHATGTGKTRFAWDMLVKSHEAKEADEYVKFLVECKGQGAKRAGGQKTSEPHPAPSSDYEAKELQHRKIEEIRPELSFAGSFDLWDSETPLVEDEVALPLFREVELAAGSGQTQVIENHGPKLRFAKSTLRRTGVLEENAACAFVRGNSMDPVLPDGTTVGVNTGEKDIRDGKIYAIDHDGMLRIKFLYRRPGGGVKIVSQNSAEHPPEEYSAQDFADHIRIIGRVFWWSVLD